MADRSTPLVKQSSLYDQDFYLWIQATVQALQARDFAQLDLENLIEEVESMGRSEKHELKSRLVVLLMHLLKWRYQPQKQTESWRSTIAEQRICLELLLEDSPSLQPFCREVFATCYNKARIKAAQETEIALALFPLDPPFNLEETLQMGYLPKSTLGDDLNH
jgi:hypothetical protein